MKRGLLLLVILVVMLAMAACVRSKATEQQVPSSDETSSDTAPGQKGDVMEQLQLFVTQTSIAAAGGQTVPEGGVQDEEEPSGEAEGTLPQDVTPTPEGLVLEATATLQEQPSLTPTAELVQPTSPPQVIVPTATPGIPTSHTIQKGESVYCISRRFNINPTEVLALNNLGSGSIVSPGQVLKIPQTGNPFPGPRALHDHPDVYIVGRGETIYAVACYYGDVDPMAIAFANGLTAPYSLTEGQQLQIP
jgi:LysM repeat protein